MDETSTVAVVKPKATKKPLKPARKQVKAGEIERKETPQTGKEYSARLVVQNYPKLTSRQTYGTTNGRAGIARITTQSE